MKNVSRVGGRLFAACLVAGALLFGACPNPAGDDPPGPDYITELAEKITLAESTLAGYKKSTDGAEVFFYQYWLDETEWNALNDAIETAKGVRDNTASTAAQRKQAIDDLSAALTAADRDKAAGLRTVDARELDEKISSIRYLLSTTGQSADGADILSTVKWITQAAYAALEAALDAAEAVLNNPASTEDDVYNAVEDLNDAFTTHYPDPPQMGSSVADKSQLRAKISEVEAALVGIMASDADGADVSTQLQWVSRTVYDAVTTALTAAQTTAANAAASTEEVASALGTLTTAFAGFAPAAGLEIPKPDFVSAKTINAAEDDYTYTVELTLDASVAVKAGGVAKDGFTITIDNTDDEIANGAAAVINAATVSGQTITFTLTEPYPIIKASAVTISYDEAAGSIVSAESTEKAAEAFSGKPVENLVAPPIHPWIKTATINTGNILDLVFSEPVRVDASKFVVKVNDKPAVRIGNYSGNNRPLLDLTKNATDRTISSAAPATSVTYHTNWTLTVSDAANYGEILRLAATALDAYVDRAGNGLPPPAETPANQQPMSQFIIRNLVPRSGTLLFTSTAGFYKNGGAVDGFTSANPGELYKDAITYLTTPTNVTDDDVFTIVLGEDQTYPHAQTFTPTQAVNTNAAAPGDNAVSYPSKSFTIVLASANGEKKITVTGTNSTAGNSVNRAGLVIRNGITLIIGNNVAFEHENGGDTNQTASGFPLIIVADGGKLILDGGEIRKNYSSVGTVPGTAANGGNFPNAAGVFLYPNDLDTNEAQNSGEAYFIMNSGKITGNIMDGNERGIGAAGLAMLRNTCFVMHGGEVSNNTFNHNTHNTNGVPQNRGGGIAGYGSPIGGAPNKNNNRSAIYITGGSVTGNKLARTTEDQTTGRIGGSAGGIIIAGTFQKTGGNISGNINDLSATVSAAARPNGVLVWRGYATAIGSSSISHVLYRDTDAGADVMLFTEGFRTVDPNTENFGFLAKSSFVPSYGTAPAFSPNGWEN